jgi:hypothetical protein
MRGRNLTYFILMYQTGVPEVKDTCANHCATKPLVLAHPRSQGLTDARDLRRPSISFSEPAILGKEREALG